jgi:Transcriptional regulator, effector-binding domain/component
MIFDFKVEEQTAQPVMSIRLRTSVEKLPQVIGESYGKIMGYLTEQGIQPKFAPFAAYYNMDMQDLDVEMGFPVEKTLPDRDEIKAGQILPGKIVSCNYKGPYREMEKPYKDIMKWIEDNGYELAGVFYEYYFYSPADVPESELLTRIVIPLK